MNRVCRSAWGIAAVALLLAAPLAAQAPATSVLEIVDRGKPLPNVPVSVRAADAPGVADVAELAGLGKPLGSTRSDGTITIRNDAAPFADGTPVEVWVVECVDGVTRVVLSEEGAGDPCADGAAEVGEGCGCRRIGGAFPWGSRRVVIDVGAGTVTGGPHDAPVRFVSGPESTQGVLGIGIGFSYLPNLEDAVRDQPGLIDADVSSTGLTVPAFFEVTPGGLPFTLGVGGAYSTLSEIRQDFDPAADGLSLGTIDFSRWILSGQLAWYRALVESSEGYDMITFRAGLQALWMFNDLKVRTEFADGDFATEDRSESGFRTGVMGGVDLYVSPRFGFRVEGGMLFGEGDDADTSFEGRISFLNRFTFAP